MVAAMEKGIYIKPSQLSLGEWLDQWLNGYVAMNTTARMQESYHSIIHRHLLPSLGSITLSVTQSPRSELSARR